MDRILGLFTKVSFLSVQYTLFTFYDKTDYRLYSAKKLVAFGTKTDLTHLNIAENCLEVLDRSETSSAVSTHLLRLVYLDVCWFRQQIISGDVSGESQTKNIGE